MKQITSPSLAGLLSILLLCGGCGQSGPPPGFTQENYDKITIGMSKADVDKILGQPASTQQVQKLLFEAGQTKWDPQTVCRYEDGKKFATISIKDDKVVAKDATISGGP